MWQIGNKTPLKVHFHIDAAMIITEYQTSERMFAFTEASETTDNGESQGNRAHSAEHVS